MVKMYVTWNPFWIYSSDNKEAMHPSEAIKRLWIGMTFTEMMYGETEKDKRMLGILEYDETKFSTEAIERFWKNFSYFTMTEITAEKAKDLCNEWYPSKRKGEDYFKLNKDGFSLIDNKPKLNLVLPTSGDK